MIKATTYPRIHNCEDNPTPLCDQRGWAPHKTRHDTTIHDTAPQTERDRERERDNRERDRDRERERQRETERDRERQRDRERERKTEREQRERDERQNGAEMAETEYLLRFYDGNDRDVDNTKQ